MAGHDNRNKTVILVRFVILLVTATGILALWWIFRLRYVTVQKEWAVESGAEEEGFLADQDTVLIEGVGFCNDNAVKDVFEEYPAYVLTGTAELKDSTGSVIWSAELDEREIPTFQTGKMDNLPGLPIMLKAGEWYYIVLTDPNGNTVEGITWTFYGEARNFLTEYLCLCGIILSLLSILYLQLFHIIRIPLAAMWFLFLFGMSAASMLAMVPPCVPDEELHFGSAYAVSNQIMNLLPALRAMAKVAPSGAVRMVGYGSRQYLYHFWTDWEYGNIPMNQAGNYYLAGMMPHYSYIVPAIGITLMRLLGAPYQLYIMAARWMNVLLYGLVTLAAMKCNPGMTSAVKAVTFLPSTLWIVNSCSYDVWSLAFCILFVCWCDRTGRQEKIRLREAAAALMLLILFVPIKFIYFNFALFLFLMQIRKLDARNPRRTGRLMLLLILAGVAAAILARGREVLTFLGNSGFDLRAEDMTMSTSYSIAWVVRHPLRTILVYLKSVYEYGAETFSHTFFGDMFSEGIPLILRVLILICFCAVMWRTAQNLETGKRERKISIVVILSGIFIVMSSFFFVYSTIPAGGIGVINGVQGRYFIPYLICLPLAAAESGIRQKESVLESGGRSGETLTFVLAGLTLLTILTRFDGVLFES